MAICALSDDALGVIFGGVRNVLEPRVAVKCSSASKGLRAATQTFRQQLKADNEAATALCLKMGMRNCKALREASFVSWCDKGLTAEDLALLGTLSSVLPALERLDLRESSARKAGPDGVQRLAAGLDAGALASVTVLALWYMHVADSGASALAAAMGRGALPRLKTLSLVNVAVGDAGLVALAPALRRLPALESLNLSRNPSGDEGLAALVAPPPPMAGAPPPPAGVLPKLKRIYLDRTQITDAGCVALAAALGSGALPELARLFLYDIPASAAAKAAVKRAGVGVYF